MSRIGPSSGDAAALQAQEQARRSPSGRHEDEVSSRGGRHETGAHLSRHEMRFGQSGAGLEHDERQAQFLESVRRALSDGQRTTDEPDPRTRLVAVAGEALPSALSLFSPALTAALVEGPAVAPSTAERVETIATRVEAAVRAERLAKGGEGLSLRLDLGDAMPGIGSLTIAMSADAIEITLARNGAEVPPDYALAAQALADRLQSRFAKRVVRIVETDAPSLAEDRSGDGLGGIARLLSNREARS